MDNRLKQAVETYLARQARDEHPDGAFDAKGRWYPSEEEHRPCCDHIRPPSRRWPYSLLLHCRTITHIANLYGVDVAELRKAVRQARPPRKARRKGGDHYYKLVAVTPDGRFVSIYDGETEYRLGETLVQRVRRGHGGGYYVYPTAQQARNADFPASARMINAPKALLRMRAKGQYTRYDNGKMAFSQVTPLEVVEVI